MVHRSKKIKENEAQNMGVQVGVESDTLDLLEHKDATSDII